MNISKFICITESTMFHYLKSQLIQMGKIKKKDKWKCHKTKKHTCSNHSPADSLHQKNFQSLHRLVHLRSENGSKMIRTQWSINENSHYWHPDYIPNPTHNGSNPKSSWMIDNWRTIISYNLKLILIITDYGRSSQKMKESPSIVAPQQ